MELSTGWVKCFLGDIVNLRNGYAFKSTEYRKQGIPIIRISDINDGVVEITDSKCIFQHEEFENFTVGSGDILIAMSGATTGKFGIYKGTAKAYQNQRVGNLKPVSESNTNKLYIFYLLYSLKRRIEKDAYGGAQPNISGSKVESIEIALPPLNEQHRIVAKIEELFSELDKGIENLKTARAQLKVYRQALLKHAFEGKLTAQWRRENQDKLETAEALQKRIQQERAQRYQQQLADWETSGKQGSKPKALKPLPPLTAEELAELPELPEGWSHIRIGNLLDVVSGNTPKGIENTKGTEIPYYRVSDMNRAGNEVSMNSSSTYLSGKEAADIGLNIFPVGTIIFPKRGGAIATNKKRRLAHSSCFDLNLMGLTNLPNSLSAGYLWLWMLALDLASISDGSNVPQINNRNVEPLAFPMCSPDEQALIIERTASRLSICDQLDQTITTSLQQAEALRQSILKKAFSGQLVPQDPHDEPAAALLARILVEREGQVAKPRKISTRDKLSPVEISPASVNEES